MNEERYHPIAILIHWLMAGVILVTWSIATVISDMPLSPTRITGYSWHKWLGVTILFLVIMRMLWRGFYPPPKFTIVMPLWQKRVMQLTHISLYILMITLPLVGWLMSSAKGFSVNYFGLFELPDLVEKNKELGIFLKETHEILANILVGLVLIHVFAALKHQLIDKDGLLSRMALTQSKKERSL
jgi:cytochrome b561